MDSVIQFLKDDILPEEKVEADKIRRLLVIGYHRTTNYISVPFQGLICYVFIPSKPSHFWKRCMKESVEAILEADP